MAADFPTTLPSLTRVSSTDAMNAPGKQGDVIINKLSDEIEAIATRVGITGSAVPTSIEYRLADVQAVAQLAADAHVVVKVDAPSGGTTSDHAKFQTAIAAAGVGGAVQLVPGATYLTDRKITLLQGQRLIGNGATLKRKQQGSTTTSTTVTANVTTTIVVADPTQLAVGQQIILVNGGTKSAAQNTISSINGSSVTVTTPFDVSVSGTTNVYSAYPTMWLPADSSVENLVFDGNSSQYVFAYWSLIQEVFVNGSRAKVSGCRFINSPGEGIMESGSTILDQKVHCRYTDNIFESIAGNPVHFSGSRYSAFERNRIKNANLNPAMGHISGGVGFSLGCMYVAVRDNFIEGCACGVGEISSWNVSYATVEGNTIVNCTTAINLQSGNTNSAAIGVTVRGNKIVNSGAIKAGCVAATASASPTGTVVSGSSTISAISSMTSVVQGALVSGTGIPADTIIGDISGNSATMTTIWGEAVVATQSGTITLSVSGKYPYGTVIESNVMLNSGTGASGAIQCGRNSGLVVQDNTIEFLPTDTVSLGIYLGASNANYLISQNTVKYGGSGIKGQTSGGDAILVQGNVLIDQTVDGINMRNVASYTGSQIVGNVIRHNGAAVTSCVGIYPGSGQSVIGNTVHFNNSGWREGIRLNGSSGNIVKNNTVRVRSGENSILISNGTTGYVVTDNAVSLAVVDTPAVGVRVANNDIIT